MTQLKCGGKHYNRFNAQIISNNNRKKNDEVRLIFCTVMAKKLQLKPPEATIFRYNNTELTCKQLHKNCSLIFVPRNPGNILVKSVSFYLERFQSYGVLKKVQLFGPPCTLHTNPRQLLLQCNERATCRPRTRAAV